MSSLLYGLIQSFAPAEKERVSNWLANPVHNKRADLRRHFSALMHGNATTDSSGVRSAELRSLEHHLLRRLEDYLVHTELKKHRPSLHRRLLLDACRRRELEAHHAARLKPAGAAPAGEDRMLLRYHTERRRQEAGLGARRGGTDGLALSAEALEHYVLYLQLRQASATLARNRVLTPGQRPPEIPRLEAILAAAAQPPYRENPSLHAFYLGVRLQREQDAEDLFRELRLLLEDRSIDLDAADRHDLLLIALNHGLRRINQGEAGAAATTLALYQLGLKDGSLFSMGRLSPFAFNNIVAISIHLREAKWAMEFVDQYEGKVPTTRRDEIVTLARARLAFSAGDYGEALRFLQGADWKDFIHQMTARVIQMKIYRANDSFNLLSSHLNSTTRLLSRKKISTGYHHENYTNIFMLARALLRLPPGDAAARAQLAEEIERTQPCTERSWLLEWLEEGRRNF